MLILLSCFLRRKKCRGKSSKTTWKRDGCFFRCNKHHLFFLTQFPATALKSLHTVGHQAYGYFTNVQQ